MTGSVLVTGSNPLSPAYPLAALEASNYYPASLVMWIKKPVVDIGLTGQTGAVFSVSSTVYGESQEIQWYRNTGAFETFRAWSRAATSGAGAHVPSNHPDNVWFPVVANFFNSSSRFVYQGALDSIENTQTRSPGPCDRIFLGASSTVGNLHAAHLAIFNGTLTANQITAVRNGSNMYEVEAVSGGTATLVRYYPGDTFDVEGDLFLKEVIATEHLPITNGSASADEPAVNPLTVKRIVASLKELDGITPLPTLLTGVRWAWFDDEPGSAQSVPVDYGTDLTIDSGELEIVLPNTTLAFLSYGYLVLEHVASGRRQAYRLQVTEGA
jgi:hypothetical protein